MIKKNGVSLIILVITIIVIIILSGAAILTMKDQDTINKSKKVVLRDDMLTFKTDFDAYVNNKQFESISLGMYYDPRSDEDLQSVEDWDKVKEFIPSMVKDYDKIIIIENGKLTYNGEDRSEDTIKIMNDVGIEIKGK